jgi:hypothetical protein
MKLAKTQKEKWREPNTETSKFLKFPKKKQQKKKAIPIHSSHIEKKIAFFLFSNFKNQLSIIKMIVKLRTLTKQKGEKKYLVRRVRRRR